MSELGVSGKKAPPSSSSRPGPAAMPSDRRQPHGQRYSVPTLVAWSRALQPNSHQCAKLKQSRSFDKHSCSICTITMKLSQLSESLFQCNAKHDPKTGHKRQVVHKCEVHLGEQDAGHGAELEEHRQRAPQLRALHKIQISFQLSPTFIALTSVRISVQVDAQKYQKIEKISHMWRRHLGTVDSDGLVREPHANPYTQN